MSGVNTLKDQVGGSHYKDRAIQPIEFILANDLDFCEGNVIKYVARHKHKGTGKEDIKKAIQYLAFVLEDCYGVVAKTTYKEKDDHVEFSPQKVDELLASVGEVVVPPSRPYSAPFRYGTVQEK